MKLLVEEDLIMNQLCVQGLGPSQGEKKEERERKRRGGGGGLVEVSWRIIECKKTSCFY